MKSRSRSARFLLVAGYWRAAFSHKALLFALSLALVVAVAAIMGFSPFTSAALAQEEQNEYPVSGPFVGTAVKFDISPPLRSITPVTKPARKAEDDDASPPPNWIERPSTDPLVQATVGNGVFTSEIPSPIVSFDGITNACGCAPPDTEGEVGPNHYVQMVNVHFRIFNKTGTPLSNVMANNTLWSGFGGACETENVGDPVVLYDQLADRWLLSQFSDSNAPFFNCIAVSTGPDPLGSYFRYSFPAMAFPDYPKYGVWPDAYYLNTRESGRGVVGNYALDRAAMLAGSAAPLFIRFDVTETASGPNGILPSDLDGTRLPPAGSPNFFVGTRDNDAGASSDALLLWRFHVDFAVPANSTFNGPTVIPISPFDTMYGTSSCTVSRLCIPQPSGGQLIDILSYRQRPTFRLAYRRFADGHESLVTNQSVEASGAPLTAGMRWWEIRSPNGTPVLFQEGTYAPGVTDNIHRWMGSIAMDKDGNMALGYSVSSAAAAGVFPGVRYTGRLASDPLGTMPQGEATMVAGAGSQTGTARWGDYSDMTVDPVDDCTFWYTQQYYAATGGTWRTRIGSFKFPSCVAGTPTPSLSPGITPSPTPTPITPTPSPTPCTPNYVTTTGTGTISPLGTDTGNNCDDCTTPITIPFPVSIYGTNYTSAVVESNGTLQFTGDTAEFVSGCNALPRANYGRTIFGYWDDLRTDTDGADGIFTEVIGTTPNRIFEIEWRTTYFGRAGTANFAIRLFESGTAFDVVYGATVDNGSEETSGVQSSGAGPFTQFSCGTPTLTSGLKVTYNRPPCGTPSPSPTGTVTASPTPSPSPTCLPGTERIADGTFEAGSPWPAWTVQTSTNFGTPNCDAGCGTGGGTAGPFAGANWSWFGGVPAVEQATLGQTYNIPAAGPATLRFQMWVGGVSPPFTDTLTVSIDGTVVQTYTEPAAAETGYTLRTIPLNFATTGNHTILFSYNGPTAMVANFSVDNISLIPGGACPSPSPGVTPTPSPSPGARTAFDFDGDHRADVSVWRGPLGQWWLYRSTAGPIGIGFGSPTDIPRAADYTGDGLTDVAFFRPSTNEWFIIRSENFTYYAFPWGAGGDIPAPADFDGDNRADAAVYRPSTQTWYIAFASGGNTAVPFGLNGDVPVPADYDGDNHADVAIYRPSAGQWWILRSSNGTVFPAGFGSPTAKPVPGDYTGDGSADIAFFETSTNLWFVLRSENLSYYAFPWGAAGDKPAPADFDGDGRFDSTIYRPSTTNWHIQFASGGNAVVPFGLPNDIPVPGQSVP